MTTVEMFRMQLPNLMGPSGRVAHRSCRRRPFLRTRSTPRPHRFCATGARFTSPDTGKLLYEFQTGSSEWWTSLWVRNARVPLSMVEVKSANHADFVALERNSDGTLNDNAGFGNGGFTFRLTGIDGHVLTDTFDWPAAGIAGQTLAGQGNFE